MLEVISVGDYLGSTTLLANDGTYSSVVKKSVSTLGTWVRNPLVIRIFRRRKVELFSQVMGPRYPQYENCESEK